MPESRENGQRGNPYCLFLGVLFNIGDGICYSADGLCLIVGDVDVEFFFKLHNQLYGVKGVCTQVVGETCIRGYLRFVNTEFVNDDVSYFAFNF